MTTKIVCPKCGITLWGKSQEDVESILHIHLKYDHPEVKDERPN